MKISVIGTGYVGLVTGVSLAEIGHEVTCIDIDEKKINRLRSGDPVIYEPGLEELMLKNTNSGRLCFTSNHQEGLSDVDVIYIAVGTPQNNDGSANLTYIESAARDIARYITKDAVIVTKSTVPVGTNYWIRQVIESNLKNNVNIEMASNPEFLREGSAVKDVFNGDRIVIGADNENVSSLIEEINKPFNIPIYKTDILSAEMIKYASNAFLATKISFINEIANICEKTGANVESVAKGMGMDQRIGPHFLNAGIGYGGSCFPKDTKALVQLAGNHHHDFELLKSVIKVNNNQPLNLVNKVKKRFGSLLGKRIALLGLAFKPNTDDMREAPSIIISKLLVNEGAVVIAYDPIAINNARKVLPSEITFTDNLTKALQDVDCAVILTEWKEIKEINLFSLHSLMRRAIVFDGRNCFALEDVIQAGIEYYSIGRPDIVKHPLQKI